MTQPKRQPRSVDELLTRTKEMIASGQLTDEQRAEMEARCRQIERLSREERESYDLFFRHMPNSDADVTLIVLKGHLLIEQRVREFISERVYNQDAIEKANLQTFQVICLAQALTLPNSEPQQFWTILCRLNTLRNELAHDLEPKGIQDRVNGIVSDYVAHWKVHPGLANVLAHAYSQLSELCRMARNSRKS